MRDVATVVRDYLLTKSGVTALVGERIYAERTYPPRGWTASNGATIVFKQRGGAPEYHSQQLNVSLMFKCYGATEVEANALYQALFEAMQDGYSANMVSAQCEVLGQTLEEPELDWVFVLCYFRVVVRR